jgi:hypothetical protein
LKSDKGQLSIASKSKAPTALPEFDKSGGENPQKSTALSFFAYKDSPGESGT